MWRLISPSSLSLLLLLLLLLLLDILPSQTSAHVRFVCPPPYTSVSSLYLQPPGGSGGRRCEVKPPHPPTEGSYTILSPGPYTLRFEETEYHKNSPFRISLHHGDASCILLDQIPHNNEASTIGKNCEIDGGLVGGCEGSSYYITVKVPDIECPACYLMVTFINTDTSTGDTCQLDNDLCTAYCSMANVKIKSSQPGLRNMSSCEDYAGNLYGRWPFTPKETYQVELPGLEPVTITHEVTWHTLTFHSPLFSKRLIKSMSICDTNLTTTAATPTTTTTTAT
ncbi:hypothetical protein Ahia01_001238200, partial [Argonauta hians]